MYTTSLNTLLTKYMYCTPAYFYTIKTEMCTLAKYVYVV